MKILLDEHLPKAVAVTLGRLLTGTDAQHIADWQHGRWLAEDDPVLLEGLWQDRRPLASYDRATLPGHLAKRIAGGKDHAGVIFVDQERFPVTRIGDMARALAKLLATYPAPSDWINRTVTLTS
ncbi:MAG: hypothetical protein WCQ21_28610 [Verrucomicrobiota bacterium]